MSIKQKDIKINPHTNISKGKNQHESKPQTEHIIQKGGEKQDFFVPILIILIAFSSFGLGRLSTLEISQKQEITFTPSTLPAATALAQNTFLENSEIQSGTLVASKNGTKYHFPWCSGAQRIKDENKVWFSSATEAKQAGYTAASNCKGLE